MQGDRIIFVHEDHIRKILADKFKVDISQVQLRYKLANDKDMITGVITLKENQVKRHGQDILNQRIQKEKEGTGQ